MPKPRAPSWRAGLRAFRSNRRPLDGHGLLGVRRLRRRPLVGALEALAVGAARLVGLGLGAHVAALRAHLGHRLVPADEVAGGVVGAAVERLPPLLGAALGDVAAVLRAEHAGGNGAGAAALREARAAEEVARAAVALEHHRPALVADVVGGLRRLLGAGERPRVL